MPEYTNGVLFQFFHWFLDKDDSFQANQPLWSFLKDEADHLRDIGIDAVWIPPAYKGASGENSSGYDVYDHYDLGEFKVNGGSKRTKYGELEQLNEAINALHGYKKDTAGALVSDGNKRYIQVYGDIVLNHRAGGSESDFWQAVRVHENNRNQERWEPGFESGLIDIKSYTKFDFIERNSKYSSFK